MEILIFALRIFHPGCPGQCPDGENGTGGALQLAGSFGYRKESDHLLFYYNAATVADPAYRINNFEVVLYDTGSIDWNFRYTLFSNNDYDLMTGLYLGPAETLFKAVAGNIPESTSFTLASVPEPASIILIGSGMLGLLVIQRIRSG